MGNVHKCERIPAADAERAVMLFNAGWTVAAVAAELKRLHGLQASIMYTKSYFGTPAEESLIQRILHNCDFAVAGIGD